MSDGFVVSVLVEPSLVGALEPPPFVGALEFPPVGALLPPVGFLFPPAGALGTFEPPLFGATVGLPVNLSMISLVPTPSAAPVSAFTILLEVEFVFVFAGVTVGFTTEVGVVVFVVGVVGVLVVTVGLVVVVVFVVSVGLVGTVGLVVTVGFVVIGFVEKVMKLSSGESISTTKKSVIG